MFNLKAIKNRDQLEAVGKGEMAAPGDPLAESEDDESAGGSDGDNGDGDGDSDSVVSDEEMMTSEGEGGEEEEEEEEESEDEGKVVSKNGLFCGLFVCLFYTQCFPATSITTVHVCVCNM